MGTRGCNIVLNKLAMLSIWMPPWRPIVRILSITYHLAFPKVFIVGVHLNFVAFGLQWLGHDLDIR